MPPQRLKPKEQVKALRSVWDSATASSSEGNMLSHLNQMNELLDSGLLFSPTKKKVNPAQESPQRYEQLQIQHTIDMQIKEENEK